MTERDEPAVGTSSRDIRRRLFAGWIAVALGGGLALLALAVVIALVR